MESLDEAGGFLRTADPTRYSACERALQQVMHTLQRLALVWKVRPFPVLHRPQRLTPERPPAHYDADGVVHYAWRPR